MKHITRLALLIIALFVSAASLASPVGFYSGQNGSGSIDGFEFVKTDTAMYVAASNLGLPDKITKRSHVWAVVCNRKKETQCHIIGHASGIGYAVYPDGNNLLGVYGSDQKLPAMMQFGAEKVVDATKFIQGVAANRIVNKLKGSKLVFIRTRYSSENSLPTDGKGTNRGFKQAHNYALWFMKHKRRVAKKVPSQKNSPSHNHGNRSHLHPLPASGLNHRHN